MLGAWASSFDGKPIESVIEAQERGDGGGGEGFGDRISDLALRFEGSHPRLAEVLGRVVNGLAELGI